MIYLWVASGGAIGAMMRYLLSSHVAQWFGASFPYGTLLVNVTGAFLIGAAFEYFIKFLPDAHELKAFIIIGVLGGFTTFSAFSIEVYWLYQKGAFLSAIAYIASSITLGVLGVAAGMFFIKALN
jgi:CrcB protein